MAAHSSTDQPAARLPGSLRKDDDVPIMRRFVRCGSWLLATLLGSGGSALADGAPEVPEVPERHPVGWVEWVRVEPGGQWLKAKLDTGAKTSSLSALELEVIETPDGADRVRFRLAGANGEPGPWVERPVARWVRIKRHDAKPDRRPVVEMEICLGGIRRSVETSLADRRKFIYPVLLGRNFLVDTVLVDAAATFTQGRCSPPEGAPDAEGDDEDEEELGEEEEEPPGERSRSGAPATALGEGTG